MTDYESLTDDQLRRAVAEALGWTDLHEGKVALGGGMYRGILGSPPDGDDEYYEGNCIMDRGKVPPNWPASLDACWRDLPVGPAMEIGMTIQVAGERGVHPGRVWCERFLKRQHHREGE